MGAEASKKLRKIRIGRIQKKLLLLLLAGFVLGCTRSPKQYFRIAKQFYKAWKDIDEKKLNQSTNILHNKKLIEFKKTEGIFRATLSEKGEQLAQIYSLDELAIPKLPVWDKKWRIVMFDVPESFKTVRDSLRMHLKNLGFNEYQKSVFVYPFPCTKEIELIANFYNARQSIRLVVATKLDKETELKKVFNLI